MGVCTENFQKSSVYSSSDNSQLTFLVHGTGHLLRAEKFLSDFGKRHSSGRPTKEIKYENYKIIENKK